jgi:hypothetical protein
MRTHPILTVVALTFVGVLATPAAGQWPSYIAPGIPRLPDGKPNLSAPAPRTSDGKPDLTGLWHIDGPGHVNGFAWNVAQDLAPDDLTPWARSVFRERLLNLGKESPMARCLPRGLPSLNAFGAVYQKIVQIPDVTMIVHGGDGANEVLRTIFTDGRALPEDPNPMWLGYSIGHWESDTLVVITTGFNDRGWLDFDGHPQTESLRVTERFRRRDFGHMEYEMTLHDPAVFEKPLSLKMDKVLTPDSELVETICENEKDAGRLVGGSGLELNAEALSKYAGTYEFVTGRQVTVAADDGFLTFQEGANAAKRALVPQSETLFVFREGGDDVEFLKDTGGAVTKFVANGRGNDQMAVRKSDMTTGEKR